MIFFWFSHQLARGWVNSICASVQKRQNSPSKYYCDCLLLINIIQQLFFRNILGLRSTTEMLSRKSLITIEHNTTTFVIIYYILKSRATARHDAKFFLLFVTLRRRRSHYTFSSPLKLLFISCSSAPDTGAPCPASTSIDWRLRRRASSNAWSTLDSMSLLSPC